MNPPISTLGPLLLHSGAVWSQRTLATLASKGQLRIDGEEARPETPLGSGRQIQVQDFVYQSVETGSGRLQLLPVRTVEEKSNIPGCIRVHAGLHKCLTMYTRKVYYHALNRYRRFPWARQYGGFRHFFHRADIFYAQCRQHAISSLSGHALELNRFQDIRVVRFIRDPRDLLISGYFYHQRGTESWCRLVDPVDDDWRIVNTRVPCSLPKGLSLKNYLNSVSVEEGLLAEIQVRAAHYQSILDWPIGDPRIRVFRYEDLFGRESQTFREIFKFFEMPWSARRVAARLADEFRLGGKEVKRGHVRNPSPGQWKAHFTPKVSACFNERFGALLERYGYTSA